ncbi:amidohydrolase family protein [Nocardioides mangrovi]|uniref:Amidohydrolase family protein n=1 Tax=Nocardioides mangrovi TaxID=2874580 RepID=A0ABS7UC44_9ACTN|nr:amidohydrolase family protein [Nocardioides mangrovi]MBZ5738450.1 amidohydrolase family protein [Nocardioides mangrovi]
MSLPRDLQVLRHATLPDGRVVDVVIDDDTVTDVVPGGGAAPAPDGPAAELDLTGFVLMTAPAEPHAHLDKARSWDAIQPPMGDLVRAIDSWVAHSATMTTEEIAARAREQALRMLRQGTTAVRTHVDLLRGDQPLRGVRALVEVREELAGLMDLQLVALGHELVDDDAYAEALDLGVDLVGGAPHLATDPFDELARAVRLAEQHDVGIDLHTDESLDGPLTIVAFARAVRGWTRPVTAGHCVRLGTLDAEELEQVVAEIAASPMGIVSLPITNLYLQGWEHPVATPRGLTALRALLDAGVPVAGGADNVRDPFNPVGRSDALETASLLVSAGHLTLDEAVTAVTDGARRVMSLPLAGAVPGRRADLLAVRGANLAEVVADAGPDRYVVHAGRLVAHSHAVHALAPTRPPVSPVSPVSSAKEPA